MSAAVHWGPRFPSGQDFYPYWAQMLSGYVLAHLVLILWATGWAYPRRPVYFVFMIGFETWFQALYVFKVKRPRNWPRAVEIRIAALYVAALCHGLGPQWCASSVEGPERTDGWAWPSPWAIHLLGAAVGVEACDQR